MTRRKLLRAHAALLVSLDLEIEQASDPVQYEASAPAVSEWSVKDHLEHLSIVNGGVVSWIERVRDGDPELDSGGGPSLAGRLVLLVGAFPRGRGKAPERTLPTGKSAEELGDDVSRNQRACGGTGGFPRSATGVARHPKSLRVRRPQRGAVATVRGDPRQPPSQGHPGCARGEPGPYGSGLIRG